MLSNRRLPLLVFAVAVIVIAAALVTGWLLAARNNQERVISSPLPPLQELPIDYVDSPAYTPDEPLQPEPEDVLPVRGDLPRYLRNATPLDDVAADTPVIAIILDDMGVHVENSEQALALPTEVTFAFLPYGRGTATQAARARTAGHEVMVHIPMQPHPAKEGKNADPGPLALTLNHTVDELAELTRMNIESLLPYAVGANNHMGSALTESKTAMRTVLNVLNDETLLFVDSLTTPDSVVTRTAKGLALPVLVRDTFLDHVNTRQKIDAALAHTERVAAEKGYAIAIGHPYPHTVAAITDWAKTLQNKNMRLVPISHLVQYVRAEAAQ